MGAGRSKEGRREAIALRKKLFRRAKRRHPKAPKPWTWSYGILRDAAGNVLTAMPNGSIARATAQRSQRSEKRVTHTASGSR